MSFEKPYRNIEIRWWLKSGENTIDTDRSPVIIHGHQETRDRYCWSRGREEDGTEFRGVIIAPYSTESDEVAIERLLKRTAREFDVEIRNLKRTKSMIMSHLSKAVSSSV